jgi:hypothetical protein
VKVSTYFSKHRWILVASISVIACCAVGLCCFLFRTPLNVQVERANLRLTERKLPTLPRGAQNIKCWTGGVFAKYMNVKFAVSRENALDYFRRAGAECYFRFQLVEDHYEVVGVQFLGDFQGDIRKPSHHELNRPGAQKRWSRSVYQIQDGWFYGRYEGEAGFRLFYDLDKEVFYIFWYYS